MQDEVNPLTFLYPWFLYFMKETVQDHIQTFLVRFASWLTTIAHGSSRCAAFSMRFYLLMCVLPGRYQHLLGRKCRLFVYYSPSSHVYRKIWLYACLYYLFLWSRHKFSCILFVGLYCLQSLKWDNP